MKHYPSYEKTQTYSDKKYLPVGGYVAKIVNVESGENQYGEYAILSFEIAEGEYKDFFNKDYYGQTGEDKKWRGTYYLRAPKDDGSERDGWVSRRFKTDIAAVEDSNPGYHWNWDEQTLKNKTVGVLFGEREYDYNGRHGTTTGCHHLISADKARSGDYKIPAVKTSKGPIVNSSSSTNENFMNFPESDSDLPLPF